MLLVFNYLIFLGLKVRSKRYGLFIIIAINYFEVVFFLKLLKKLALVIKVLFATKFFFKLFYFSILGNGKVFCHVKKFFYTPIKLIILL